MAGDRSGQGLLRNFSRIAAGLGPFSPAMAQLSSLFNITNILGGGAAVAGLKILGLAVAFRLLREAVLLVVHTVQQLVSQVSGAAATGGNLTSFSTLSAMLGPDAVAAARGFRDRISSNGMAMVEAQRHGMRAFPREFGMTGVDDASLLLKEIATIRGFKTEAEALRHTMILGTEELYKWRFATEGQVQAFALEGRTRAAALKSMGPMAVQAALEMQRFTNTLEDLKTVLGLAILVPLNAAIAGAKLLFQFSQQPTQFWRRFFLPEAKNGASGGMNEALNSNTAAINNNTRAIRASGATFGGPAAQHALPAGLRGLALHQALADGSAARLGQLRY